VFAVWSDRVFRDVLALSGRGLSDYEVARLTGVPRGTVLRWRHNPTRAERLLPIPTFWRPPKAAAYCYLLGLYLGDGHLSCPIRGAPYLRFTLDERYTGIIEEACDAIRATAPKTRVRRYASGTGGAVVLHATDAVWAAAFPQHGPGKKHHRPIRLARWQADLTRQYPRELIRGLIHSDGARVMNRFSVRLPSGRDGHYEYVRYFFSNLSSDIRRIFCQHCDLLGVGWTQSNPRNISISHRRSVAILDSFVGPKT
jgi:hypothetical protein